LRGFFSFQPTARFFWARRACRRVSIPLRGFFSFQLSRGRRSFRREESINPLAGILFISTNSIRVSAG